MLDSTRRTAPLESLRTSSGGWANSTSADVPVQRGAPSIRAGLGSETVLVPFEQPSRHSKPEPLIGHGPSMNVLGRQRG